MNPHEAIGKLICRGFSVAKEPCGAWVYLHREYIGDLWESVEIDLVHGIYFANFRNSETASILEECGLRRKIS